MLIVYAKGQCKGCGKDCRSNTAHLENVDSNTLRTLQSLQKDLVCDECFMKENFGMVITEDEDGNVT